MKIAFHKTPCLIICFVFLYLGSVEAQTAGGSSACAVSVDVAFIGEICVLGGLALRSGFDERQWEFNNPESTEGWGSKTIQFKPKVSLAPIAIATKPTKLSWIHFQFFIDFSLYDTLTADDSNERFMEMNTMSLLMSDSQLDDLTAFGVIDSYTPVDGDISGLYNLDINEGWDIKADLSYEFIMVGLMVKAPWPYFFKPFLGIGLNYEKIDIDVFFSNNNGTKVSFYEAKTNNVELVRIIGAELFNFEDVLFDGSNLVIGKFYILDFGEITMKGKNGVEQNLRRTKLNIEFANWGFTF